MPEQPDCGIIGPSFVERTYVGFLWIDIGMLDGVRVGQGFDNVDRSIT